jgi:hypothetical protein
MQTAEMTATIDWIDVVKEEGFHPLISLEHSPLEESVWDDR